MTDTLTLPNPSALSPRSNQPHGRERSASADGPQPAEVLRAEDRILAKLMLGGLARGLRETLKQHVDGPLPIVRDGRTDALDKLVARGLLSFDRPNFPRFTSATEKGRTIIAAMLEAEADTLVKRALGNA